MILYVRFISTLAFGLIGMGAVLKVLLETIFEDWDAFNDIAARVSGSCSGEGAHMEHIRAEDILLEAERQSAPMFSSRIADTRRRNLQEIDAVETRLTQVQTVAGYAEPEIVPS